MNSIIYLIFININDIKYMLELLIATLHYVMKYVGVSTCVSILDILSQIEIN